MSESTLTLTYEDFHKECAFTCGWPRVDSQNAGGLLTAAQLERVDFCVQDGYRRFLMCDSDAPGAGLHIWSFLRPAATFTTSKPNTVKTLTWSPTTKITTLVANASCFGPSVLNGTVRFSTTTNEYPVVVYTSDTTVGFSGNLVALGEAGAFTVPNVGLPDDFGSLEWPITFALGTGHAHIDDTGESQIRMLRQQNTALTPGRPRQAAVRALRSDGTGGQRWQLMLHPIPDAMYPLGYRYNVLAEKLSHTALYALGGMFHTQTILEGCLAAVELHIHRLPGIHAARFQELLARSIAHDRNLAMPGTLGNLDDPTDRAAPRRRTGVTTYNGVAY